MNTACDGHRLSSKLTVSAPFAHRFSPWWDHHNFARSKSQSYYCELRTIILHCFRRCRMFLLRTEMVQMWLVSTASDVRRIPYSWACFPVHCCTTDQDSSSLSWQLHVHVALISAQGHKWTASISDHHYCILQRSNGEPHSPLLPPPPPPSPLLPPSSNKQVNYYNRIC